MMSFFHGIGLALGTSELLMEVRMNLKSVLVAALCLTIAAPVFAQSSNSVVRFSNTITAGELEVILQNSELTHIQCIEKIAKTQVHLDRVQLAISARDTAMGVGVGAAVLAGSVAVATRFNAVKTRLSEAS